MVLKLNQPKFRAKQLYEWIHRHGALSYGEMSNIPKPMRESLEKQFPLFIPKIIDKQTSVDGTRKYVLELNDKNKVEVVGLPSERVDSDSQRLTVCFSTQVGCPMECSFCATGKEGFTRNLSADEMITQILIVQKDFGKRVTNIVAMGQGEPFLNYAETLKALRFLNDQSGFKIGARHITVSTCGIISGIEQFSNEPEQFTLAISLHSAIQEKRDLLMPRTANHSLPTLKKALASYIAKTNRRVTFEYLLIKDTNDSETDLNQLIEFCKGLLCHVNILPMNKIKGAEFLPSSKRTIEHWISELEGHSIETTLRKSRGSDIAGACGQLKNSLTSMQNVSRETF